MSPKKIALLTDSCADIPKALAKERGIHVIPLRILCEDGEYQDGVNICNQDIYRRQKQGEMPKTSLPAAEDIEIAMEQIIKAGYDGAIAVMMSSALSGTYNLARIAAEECEGKFHLRAYDSLSASLGQGMTLLQLAEDIRGGMSWEELTERRVPFLLERATAHFSVDTLEYLQKGGRIGKVSATAGTLLQIKPILSFAEDGQLRSEAKVRGRNQVIDKLVELTVQACGDHKRYNLAVANGGAPEEMEKLKEKLTAALPEYDNLWAGEIDSTLSVYIGEGMLGAAVQVLD